MRGEQDDAHAPQAEKDNDLFSLFIYLSRKMEVITEMTHLTPYDLRRMLSNYGWQPSHIWISGAELWRHQHYEFSDVLIPVGKTALDRECFQNMMDTAVLQISIHTKIPIVDLLEWYGQPSPGKPGDDQDE